MKISDIINKLQEMQENYGDLDVLRQDALRDDAECIVWLKPDGKILVHVAEIGCELQSMETP
jgi:hypothetical protein